MISIVHKPSPNFNDRKDGATPSFIIIHYTGTKTAIEAIDRYLDPDPKEDNAGPISPHYLIDGNGTVYHFVAEEKRAWHAGVSEWQGLTDLNSHSVGIEIWNEGDRAGYPDFLPAQIDALIELCRAIMARWPGIAPERVLGHSDIAPGRKLDPGPKFPWARLVDAGIAVFDRTAPPSS